MGWLDGVSVGFELLGAVCFLVSIVFWTANLLRSKRVGILDYSMFTLHPLFILCTLFTGVLLIAAVKYFWSGEAAGFRISIGAAVMFLSLLVWNTGFVTNRGLFLTGAPINPLTAKQENGLLLFTPERHDPRASRPIAYENTPENRAKFSALLK